MSDRPDWRRCGLRAYSTKRDWPVKALLGLALAAWTSLKLGLTRANLHQRRKMEPPVPENMTLHARLIEFLTLAMDNYCHGEEPVGY